MSYVDSALLPGEVVTYRTHLHKVMFVRPALFLLVGAALCFSTTPAVKGFGVILLAVGLIDGLARFVTYSNAEFAVTSKRVIIKVGLLSRRTLEMQVSKIETVVVDQSLMGRMIGFGTIRIVGSGGTNETFSRIAAPLEFRRAVQSVST